MKTFEKFLTESQKPIKQFGDAQFKSGTFDMADTQSQLRKSKSKEITKRLENLANKKKNVVPGSEPPVTRFDPTEPFMDDDLGQRTGKTGDKVVNKPATQTGKVVLGPDGKPLVYKGKNVPVASSTPGSTQLTGIQDKDLESVARGQETQAKRNIQTSKVETPKNTVKVDQKSSVDDLTKTTKRVNKVKTLTPRQLQNVKVKNQALKIIKDLGTEKKIEDAVRSRNITKQISKSRELKRLGFGDTTAARTINKKITELKPKVNITNPKIVSGTTDAAQKYSKLIKKAKFGRGLRTLGRGAGALTSYLDFKATADKERRLGRGKTSQTIGGLSRSLGGYIGGALGAGLAAPIPIPGARILGAIGGYTAGAATGEKLYNVGRKFLTRGTKIGGKTYADFKNMLTRKK